MRVLAIVALLGAVACANGDSPSARRPPHRPPEAWLPGPAEPVIDGQTGDWSDAELLADDTIGDAAPEIDVGKLYATSRGTRLFVRFDRQVETQLYSGPGSAQGLVLEVELDDGRLLAVDFRARSAEVGGADLNWSALGLVAAPSHAAKTHELRLELSELGVAEGDAVRIGLASSDEDEVVAARKLELTLGPAEPTRIPAARHPDTGVRLVSLNTYKAALFAPSRAAASARLLRAAMGDIYCLQELGSTPASLVAERLESIDPGDWHVHAAGAGSILGNAIASKSPLMPIPTGTVRFVGAMVLSEPPLAVFDVHLKCCGYQGSDEDTQRLTEVELLATAIRRFRQGALGTLLAEYADAAVVVMGDFNDVGSGSLHTRLTLAGDPGLSRWPLSHLQSPDVFTWSSWDGGFPPATLDLLFYDPSLEALSGYLLDSRELDEAALEELGLWANDSAASDHLMLVADFR